LIDLIEAARRRGVRDNSFVLKVLTRDEKRELAALKLLAPDGNPTVFKTSLWEPETLEATAAPAPQTKRPADDESGQRRLTKEPA
jgi:hypothetical protein